MTRLVAFASILFAVSCASGTVPAHLLAAPGRATPWWRSGVCYEVFVRSFADADGDGVGDQRGLI
jgi:hypothetical protein